MKAFILLALLSSNTVYANDLVNCVLYNNDGKKVVELDTFDIEKYDTTDPEATIDGSLTDFSQTNEEVFMNFSNQCDNNYFITFKSQDIKAAKAYKISTITAKASVEQYGVSYEGQDDLVIEGSLVCEVKNSK